MFTGYLVRGGIKVVTRRVEGGLNAGHEHAFKREPLGERGRPEEVERCWKGCGENRLSAYRCRLSLVEILVPRKRMQ